MDAVVIEDDVDSPSRVEAGDVAAAATLGGRPERDLSQRQSMPSCSKRSIHRRIVACLVPNILDILTTQKRLFDRRII